MRSGAVTVEAGGPAPGPRHRAMESRPHAAAAARGARSTPLGARQSRPTVQASQSSDAQERSGGSMARGHQRQSMESGRGRVRPPPALGQHGGSRVTKT